MRVIAGAILGLLLLLVSIAEAEFQQGVIGIPYSIGGFYILLTQDQKGNTVCTVDGRYVLEDPNECPQRDNEFFGTATFRKRMLDHKKRMDKQLNELAKKALNALLGDRVKHEM